MRDAKTVIVKPDTWKALSFLRAEHGDNSYDKTIKRLIEKKESPSANGLGKGIEPPARGDQHYEKHK